MKNLLNKYIWLQFILSILLIFGGTIIIVFATNEKTTDYLANVLNITVAVIFFLFGGFAIVASYIFGAKRVINLGFLYGSISIALGIFLCAKEIILLDHLTYLLSLFLIVFGAVELIKAIFSTIFRLQSTVIIVISYIFATLFLVAGILSIIYREKITTVYCIIAGAVIALAGLFLLGLGIKIVIDNLRNNRKAVKEAPTVEPEVKDEPVNDVPPTAGELDYTSQEEQKENGQE